MLYVWIKGIIALRWELRTGHMADLQSKIATQLTRIENRYDGFKLKLRRKVGSGIGPITILPYLGHGTRKMIYLQGRVVADYRVSSPLAEDNVWKNMRNSYRRFHTYEVPHAKIKARFEDVEQEFVANEEGHFKIRLELSNEPPLDKFWHDLEITLADDETVTATGRVLIPPTEIQYGVISDLDDTVVKSDVLQIWKLLTNTFLKNSRTRLPFAGVAAFYQALQQGTAGGFNPIYYVTSGPWNLFDVYWDFIETQKIPMGPLFMTDMGLTEKRLIKASRFEHKLGAIRELLATHPKLPFILIGDSGEKDAEIYGQVAVENPGRVLAIYIRDVSQKRRDSEVQAIIKMVMSQGTDILLVEDTVAAANHAVEHGYILAEMLPDIRQERREDKPLPTPLEELVGGEEKIEKKSDAPGNAENLAGPENPPKPAE